MAKILKRTGSAYFINDTGQTVPQDGQLTIDPNSYSLYARSDDTIAALASGDLVYNDGSNDLSLAEATIHLQGSYPSQVSIADKDGDTGAVKVTNSFAPDGFYQRLHEVEFTTSILGGNIHDRDIDNNDNGWSSVVHYELIGGVETIMSSPTQTDLDNNCIRTDFRFMPSVDYMVKSGTIAHDTLPASEVYIWGKMLDTDPALHPSGILPITVLDGGLAMTFVPPRTPVGLKGVNGSLLFYDGVNTPGGKVATPPGLGTNRITFVCRHQAGLKHRFQSIFEIFRTP
jgi:hypothetical protein